MSPDLASLLVQLGQAFTDGSDLKRAPWAEPGD